MNSTKYDVIVVGAGHAGVESALSSARMGMRVLLMTINIDFIALPPCNPSIGGTAKGQVVREIDALGGEMGKNIDETFIQIRMLNSSKGPAVRSLRAQMDRMHYMERMRKIIQTNSNIDLKQGIVVDLMVDNENDPTKVSGVRTNLGESFFGDTVILTTGTSLKSKIIIGDTIYSGGRNGEMPAEDLSQNIQRFGFKITRWKTGTPPRVNAYSIDFSKLSIQPGSNEPLSFAHNYDDPERNRMKEQYYQRFSHDYLEKSHWGKYLRKNAPDELDKKWLPQVPCFLLNTNEVTHEIVRSNFHRAPLFSGVIEGTGPRYCPSFEDKVKRFPDKDKHHFFLEPEGWDTNEIYVQGANTSLPLDVQKEFIRSLPGMKNAELMRAGYAIEYDGISTSQLYSTLESKVLSNLFLAGQINGTSGYEEAAGQGLVAGINASRKVQGKEPIILSRSNSYIGVMIDDIVNRDIDEPYRLMTSRSEYRLLLRSDNADLRLTEIGREVGLVTDEQYRSFVKYREDLVSAQAFSEKTKIKANEKNNEYLGNISPRLVIKESTTIADLLKRPDINIHQIIPLEKGLENFSPFVREELEIMTKYEGYIARQREVIAKMASLENTRIPEDFDYQNVIGIRIEAREKLNKFRPQTLGQASRISGVNPADITVLMVWIQRAK